MADKQRFLIPIGVISTWTYDDVDRVTGITYEKAGTLETIIYTLDALGNRISMADSSGTTAYSYDDLNRLTNVVYPTGIPGTVSYSYDPMGNRQTKIEDGNITSYTYDAADRLLTTTTNSVTTNYTWDENGNLLTKGGQTFNWDEADRLSNWTDGSNVVSYSYNGDGVRISKTVDGVATTYLQDLFAGLPIVLRETTSGMTTDYIYGTDLIASIDNSGISAFFHADGLGSTRLLTDGSGVVADRYSYDAFGSVRDHSGSSGNTFTFTGEQVDSEAGLVYLRARYYDPETGRFISKDVWRGSPLLPQTINRYVYVVNNPVTETDPTGAVIEKLREKGANMVYNLQHPGEYAQGMKQALADPIARGFVLDELSENADIVKYGSAAVGFGPGYAFFDLVSNAADLVNLGYTTYGLSTGTVPRDIAVRRAIDTGVGMIVGAGTDQIAGLAGEGAWKLGSRNVGVQFGGYFGQFTSYGIKELFKLSGLSGVFADPLSNFYLNQLQGLDNRYAYSAGGSNYRGNNGSSNWGGPPSQAK